MNARTLDYAEPRKPPFSGWRFFVWLAPLWGTCIIAIPLVFGWRDDPFWYAAIALIGLVGIGCLMRRRYWLAAYCFGTLALLLAISVILPSLNRAI